MKTINETKKAKTTFLGAFIFYFLIAFEFAYMAGPFAAFFYSGYSPILNFFNKIPALSWVIQFFFPHAVRETSSLFINVHEIIGGTLAVVGFIGFCIGACKIYYNKLTKKGAVTKGIYKYIRHPQYSCFIICSFGLLIIWPRYIVVITFITMLFAYYLLAKAEEKECEEKFGQTYIDYKNKTNMFIPFNILPEGKILHLPKSKFDKILSVTCLYLVTALVSLTIAKCVNVLSINSLYSVYTDNSANISVCKIDADKLENVLNIALSDDTVKENLNFNINDKYLNYVLPTEWYAAEIPMNGIEYRSGHQSPSDYNHNLYKVIFTKAQIRGNEDVDGKDILLNVEKRNPLLEVWVDVSQNKIIEIMDMPDHIKYDNIPVAVY